VLSASNTAREMAASARLFCRWCAGGPEVNLTRTVRCRLLITRQCCTKQTLEGGMILPGFTLPFQELFGELTVES
jgi:hypothetical protein